MASDTDQRTLFIANLDRNVSEELLYELFFQAGPIERVSIPGNNNDPKYGFVTYKHLCSIQYALDLYKGTFLNKREVVIKRKGERTEGRNQNVDMNHPFDFAHKLRQYQEHRNEHFSQNALRGNWTNRDRPYNRESNRDRSYERSRSDRRDYGNRQHHRDRRH